MEVQWLQQKWSYLLYFTHRIYLISFNRTTAPGQLQGVKIHALSHLSLFPCRLALQRAGRSPPPHHMHHSRFLPQQVPRHHWVPPQTTAKVPSRSWSAFFSALPSSGSDELLGDSSEGPCSRAKSGRRREAERIPDPEIHCPLMRGSQMHGTSSTTHR